MRWAGHVTRIGHRRDAHKILVGKPEGKGPLPRPRPRRENKIKIALQEIVRGASTEFICLRGQIL